MKGNSEGGSKSNLFACHVTWSCKSRSYECLGPRGKCRYHGCGRKKRVAINARHGVISRNQWMVTSQSRVGSIYLSINLGLVLGCLRDDDPSGQRQNSRNPGPGHIFNHLYNRYHLLHSRTMRGFSKKLRPCDSGRNHFV